MNVIQLDSINTQLNTVVNQLPTIFITRGEDIKIIGYIKDQNLTGYTITNKIATRDLIDLGFSYEVVIDPNQTDETKGKFELTLDREVTKELIQNEYLCFIYIIDPSDTLSIPEGFKIMMRMLGHPMIPGVSNHG